MTAPRRDQDSVCQGREDGGESGIARLIPEPHPSLCSGPASGCPILFQTKLSNPGVFVHTAPSPETQAPHKGAFSFLAERLGLLGSSLSLAPRCARGQPPAVQFCSRQNCRTQWVRPHHPSPETENARKGRFRFWRRGWDSNPRYGKTVNRISNPAHSTTLPPLRAAANDRSAAPDFQAVYISRSPDGVKRNPGVTMRRAPGFHFASPGIPCASITL